MQGGDLEAGLSRRIYVHVDTFRTVEPGTRKLFKVIFQKNNSGVRQLNVPD